MEEKMLGRLQLAHRASTVRAARTCTDAAAQARAALRRYRDAQRDASSSSSSSAAADAPHPASDAQPQPLPLRLTVQLPLPSPGHPGDDSIFNYNQADWPGGILQRFRRLRPLVEDTLLAGYDPQFVGMLESQADGIGVWRAAGGDMTVVAQVGNLNFAPFTRLCAGEFGGAVLAPGHTLVAVNPTFTSSRDIGQLWDRKLKQQAAELIDDPSLWLPLYHLSDLRTARGATGLLFRAWPHPWTLFHTSEHQEEPTAALGEPPVLVAQQRPSREQQTEALNAALAAARQRRRQER